MAFLRYVSKQTLLIIFTKIDTERKKRNIKILSGIRYSPTFSGLGKSIRAFTRDVNIPRSIFLLLYLTILENMPTVDSKTVLVARSDLTNPLGWEDAPPIKSTLGVSWQFLSKDVPYLYCPIKDKFFPQSLFWREVFMK